MAGDLVSPWAGLARRLRRAGTLAARAFGSEAAWQPQASVAGDVFRPVAGSNARMRVMDDDFSLAELLTMERRRCIELQRENIRLRYLSERLGMRVKILEQ